ncbi:Npt1/Npt2 family nucleotide transporter [Candidatus Similichlamydia laticola]|nr:Npt1/Npt2 family nucleotide transporter [Candidatus Similichlamydia laticola]
MVDRKFGKFRSIFWPIHRRELVPVLGLMAVFFFAAFSYHLLRQIKDNLILDTTKGGMEVVPFIKGWILFPLSFLAVYLISASERWLEEKTTLMLSLGSFLGYFLFFFLWIYPNRASLNCHFLADFLEGFHFSGLNGMILMIRHWHVSVFYVIAELWGSLVIQVTLWGFVNDMVPISDAKRIYVPLNFALSISGVLASSLSVHFLFNQNVSFPCLGTTRWEQGFKLALVSVLISGFISLILIKTLPLSYWKKRTERKEGDPLSFSQHFLQVLTRPYTLYLAMSVFSFNILSSTLELFWKEHIRELHDVSSGAFSLHVSQVMTWMAFFTTLSCFAFSNEVIRFLPWNISFLLTPLVVSLTVFVFFFSATFPKIISPAAQMVKMSPLQLTVLTGDVAICISRIFRYVLFDLIKELSYLPLGKEERIQAKTFIDGLVSRAGRITSSVLSISLMSLGGNLIDSILFMHLLCTGISVAWIGVTSRLSTLFIHQEKGAKK